jgi:hypothetical protein
MKVRAAKCGHYDDKRRRIGDVFELLDPKDFSSLDGYRRRRDAGARHITARGA